MHTGTALDRASSQAQGDTSKLTPGKLPTPGAIRAAVPQVNTSQLSALTDIFTLDSDVQRSVYRHVELILSGGVTFTSDNPEAAKALQQRLHLMAIVSGYGNELVWLAEATMDLVIYQNAFFSRRQSKAQLGLASQKARAIVCYDILPPETIRYTLDKDRRIKEITSNGVTYSAKDVIQIHFLRASGHLFAISTLFPALDDIKMVRSMEDIVYEMVLKNLHPILHARVGVDTPVRVPEDDLHRVNEAIKNMDAHSGFMVTRGHTKLEMIGSESRALRTEGLIDRFRARVYDALNLPADRKKAERIPSEMKDRIGTIRLLGLGMIETTIFYELLLAEGFDPINKPEDRVKMVFNAPDPDDQIKLENHQQQLYVQGLAGLNEMRIRMKLRPCDDVLPGSREDFMYERERLPLAQLGSNYSPGSVAPSQDQPENQHGKQGSPGVGST